ncbi:CBS domain-containing protein [Salinibaculum salinum]|uniref:CBS domain-containing protein n=1 Tax=Salinibaculum salinum TaxID=3131996 RepID=UPI0030EDC9C9
MDDIFVARLMSSGVISVTPDTLVEEAADTLLDEQIGSLVVVDGNNQLKGILTSTDFVRIVRDSKPKAQTTVERYMTDQVVTVEAQDSIRDAADKMITYNIHHLPVVDDEEGVIGMLSTTDLTAYISDVVQPSPA